MVGQDGPGSGSGSATTGPSYRVFSARYVVVASQVSEGMCNSLLEAMLVGTQVLARANAGNAALIAQQAADYPLSDCVISGQGVSSKGDPVDVLYGNTLVRLCCNGCVSGYEKDPAKYAAMVRKARGL